MAGRSSKEDKRVCNADAWVLEPGAEPAAPADLPDLPDLPGGTYRLRLDFSRAGAAAREFETQVSNSFAVQPLQNDRPTQDDRPT
jgi:hypothetical protein